MCLPLHWNEANIGTSKAPLMRPQTLAQRFPEPVHLGILAKALPVATSRMLGILRGNQRSVRKVPLRNHNMDSLHLTLIW